MKKSDRKLLGETLDRALDPPLARRKPALAANLAAYDDETEEQPHATSTALAAPIDATSRGVTPPDPTRPVSPARDFNKRANSLDRLALPAGLFPGSSKKLYDALYIRTRGAVVPTRSIRATKRELSEWSGIRNAKTIDAHLRYFSALGLVLSTWERGQNEGALYDVLLPEETSGIFVKQGMRSEVAPPDPTSPHVTPPNVGTGQNLGSPHDQNLGSPHPTNTPEESTVYGDDKTSFKTNTERSDDDEAFGPFLRELKQAVEDVTGKGVSGAEAERWREVAEVLATEFRIAGARTTVSSAPAFLAEHLRRRLFKKDKRQLQAERDAAPPRAQLPPDVDLSACPDCHGAKYWYPEGYEKGVDRCRHEKLLPAPSATPENPHTK